ncbi:CocE/NonD family hydrolase [Arachidicoccus ginsenosidivorans]|uniref:CocE/NonD family hydrolase n=1 Tax=Arachidicoccus ginsenosidivorans TaxID=496057 RepID=A0A5B8VP27_9BACT|nr:CocE/NonD family hydrolase [Arachidicoccus ginsenosidivorans]QEC73374.1 CocE/NonD family hydrolase [Arachidicoccus ginsenosidivorans]
MKRPFAFLILLFVYSYTTAFAQPNLAKDYIKNHYTKAEYMIPMRDGVKLYTAVYTPKDTSMQYPFMLNRTCYSAGPYGKDNFPARLGPSPEFTRSGFIFVYQDVRGKYKSEGSWTEITPFIPHKTGSQHDEASDTYDAVDWLIHHAAHNNGKVGVWGISYPGFFATNAALSGHPAIKAVSPQAPVTNWFLGDDTHHKGAFFLMDEVGFDYWFANSTNGPNKNKLPKLELPIKNAYDFYLKLGPVSQVNALYYHHQVPFWDTVLMHPNYDQWWQARDISAHMHHVKPATLLVGGWYDAEDLWGTLETYKTIEKNNPGNTNTLIMGPWNHGGWAGTHMDHLGDIAFNGNTSRWFQKNIEFPFFVHYLKNEPQPNLPEAVLYDVGLNRWNKFDAWPAKAAKDIKYFFNTNGQLTNAPSVSNKNFATYISDPAHPVPYQGGIRKSRGITYMIDDQRFASKRKDVLSFTTPILKENTTLAGPVKAHLNVSISTTDADFVVKIIDVYPDSARGKMSGYQALVRAEVMRGKYRKSFTNPLPFTPGKITKVDYTLPDLLYTFKKGHKIMIQVQSSWFPLVDRNPQVFENIYKAKAADFTAATIKLYFDKNHPSYIESTVLDEHLYDQHQFTVGDGG